MIEFLHCFDGTLLTSGRWKNGLRWTPQYDERSMLRR